MFSRTHVPTAIAGTAALVSGLGAWLVTELGTVPAGAVTELIGAAATTASLDSPDFADALYGVVRRSDARAAAVIDAEGRITHHTDSKRIGHWVPPSTARVGDAIAQTVFGERGPTTIVRIGVDQRELVVLGAAPHSLARILPFLLLAVATGAIAWGVGARTNRALEGTESELDPIRRALVADGTFPERGDLDGDQIADLVVEALESSESLHLECRTLEFERNRRQQVLDSLPDGVVMTDNIGDVTYVNRAGAALMSVRAEDAIGQPFGALNAALASAAASAQRTGRAVLSTGEEPARRHLLLRRVHLVADGSPTGTLYSVRDVTQQHAAERAQAEFVSQLSHELKAPLNTIVTYVDALADSELLDENERGQYFNTLSSEAQRMGRLISNLLQISRIELGNLSAKFAFVKSSTLIRNLAESFTSQAEGLGHTLRVNVPSNLPPLYGDKDLLSVAISNLVSNAIKYTPPGGDIEVTAAVDVEGLVIRVRDSGIGIPDDELDRVFERFHRSEQPEVREVGGTGLGLSLVREIVQLHEGRVRVESTIGQGSEFIIELPIREVGERLDLAAA